VLAGVLLGVVDAARGVDVAGDLGAFVEGLADVVPDFAGLIFFDALYIHFQGRAGFRSGDEGAGVVGLAAAGGVEGGAVEGDLPEGGGFRGGGGDEADVGDLSGEGECGGVVVEAGGDGQVGLRWVVVKAEAR
jgi:hypothetical protein